MSTKTYHETDIDDAPEDIQRTARMMNGLASGVDIVLETTIGRGKYEFALLVGRWDEDDDPRINMVSGMTDDDLRGMLQATLDILDQRRRRRN